MYILGSTLLIQLLMLFLGGFALNFLFPSLYGLVPYLFKTVFFFFMVTIPIYVAISKVSELLERSSASIIRQGILTKLTYAQRFTYPIVSAVYIMILIFFYILKL